MGGLKSPEPHAAALAGEQSRLLKRNGRQRRPFPNAVKLDAYSIQVRLPTGL
jgi:hypothetical protein